MQSNIALKYPLVLLSLIISLIIFSADFSSAQQNWRSFEDAQEAARQSDRLIVVDVWAPWCGWCHKMKQETYPNLSRKLEQHFVFTRLNKDNRDTKYSYKGQKLNEMQLAKQLNAQTIPAVVILSSDGDYLFHISGFLTAQKLEKILLQTKFTSRQ